MVTRSTTRPTTSTYVRNNIGGSSGRTTSRTHHAKKHQSAVHQQHHSLDSKHLYQLQRNENPSSSYQYNGHSNVNENSNPTHYTYQQAPSNHVNHHDDYTSTTHNTNHHSNHTNTYIRPSSASTTTAAPATRPSTSPVYNHVTGSRHAHKSSTLDPNDDIIVKLGIQLGEATQRAQSSHGNRSSTPSSSSSSSKKSSDKQRSEAIRRSWTSVNAVTHYTVANTIGEGTFGKVKLGIHKLSGIKVAIKILEKDRISDMSDVERVKREIRILCRVQHRNVIRLYQVIDSPKHIFLIMEYASNGELFDYIVKHQRVDEPTACILFHEILNGVDSCHQRHVIHRDLKPENLLLTEDNQIRIVDFGLGNLVSHSKSLLKTACGSPCYAAPEMIRGQQYIGSAVDMWSQGVILYALLCGYLPFEDSNTNKLYEKIMSGTYYIPSHVSPAARDLLSKLLCTDPSKRYTAHDVRHHEWYTQCTVDTDPSHYHDPYDIDVNTLNHHVLQYMSTLGYDRETVIDSIVNKRLDHYSASYELLNTKYTQLQRQTSSAIPKDVYDIFNRMSMKTSNKSIPPLNIPIAMNLNSLHPSTHHTVRRKDSMEADTDSSDSHPHSQAHNHPMNEITLDEVTYRTASNNNPSISSTDQHSNHSAQSIAIIQQPAHISSTTSSSTALSTPHVVDNTSPLYSSNIPNDTTGSNSYIINGDDDSPVQQQQPYRFSSSTYRAPMSTDDPEVLQYPVTHLTQHQQRPTTAGRYHPAILNDASNNMNMDMNVNMNTVANGYTPGRQQPQPLTSRPASRSTIQRAVLHSRGIVKTSHPQHNIYSTMQHPLTSRVSSAYPHTQTHTRTNTLTLASPRSGSSRRPTSFAAVHEGIGQPGGLDLQHTFLISRPYALQSHRLPVHQNTAAATMLPHPPQSNGSTSSVTSSRPSSSRPLTARKPPVPRQNYGRKPKPPSASVQYNTYTPMSVTREVENIYAPQHNHNTPSSSLNEQQQQYFQRATTTSAAHPSLPNKARPSSTSRVSSATYRGHPASHQHNSSNMNMNMNTYTLHTQSPAAGVSRLPHRQSSLHAQGHGDANGWMNNIPIQSHS